MSFIQQTGVKEELDDAVPPHNLLDVSATRSKAELATRGGLGNRQLPSQAKKHHSSSSLPLSNSSSVSCQFMNKYIINR